MLNLNLKKSQNTYSIFNPKTFGLLRLKEKSELTFTWRKSIAHHPA